MNKKAVILPVETKSRELHGKLFLALNLLAKGHPVLIGEQGRLWEMADLVAPAIYVDKSIAATHTGWIRRCRAMGHEVVSWDEEGLIFFEPWMYRKLRVEPKSFEGLSRFFAWGEVQRDAICEEYPSWRDKIALCGNPRFDLLRPELREFYREEVDALKRQFGKMLLVNTNFALHNHFKAPEQVRQAQQREPAPVRRPWALPERHRSQGRRWQASRRHHASTVRWCRSSRSGCRGHCASCRN